MLKLNKIYKVKQLSEDGLLKDPDKICEGYAPVEFSDYYGNAFETVDAAEGALVDFLQKAYSNNETPCCDLVIITCYE